MKFSTLILLAWIHTLLFSPAQLASAQMMATGEATAEDASTTEVIGYDRVRDVLRKRCVTCHNLDELRGDLNLADPAGIMAGSGSGAVVVAGNPNQSPLYTTAAHLEDPIMPPNSPAIPARELDLLRRWIEGGLAEKSGEQAVNPEHETAPEVSSSAVGEVEAASSALSGFTQIKPLFQPSPLCVLAGHSDRELAAMAGQQQIVLLDSLRGEWLGALDFPEGDVTALQFSSDGEWLIAAGGVPGLSGRVVGFDIKTGERVFELADENDTILSVDLSPDKQLVAVGGPAKVVRLYRVEDGSVVHTLRKHTDWVLTVRFSPDGLLLASGDRFGGLFVWNPATGEEFHVLRGHTGPVHRVAWDDGSETLISGGEDGQLRTWNMHHGELTVQWDAGVGAVLGLDTRAGRVLAGGRKGLVVAWQGPDVQIGSYATQEQVECVVWSGERLLAGDVLGRLHRLDDRLQEINQLELPNEPRAAAALLVRLDKAEQEYQAQLRAEQAEKLAAAAEAERAQTAASASTLALSSGSSSPQASMAKTSSASPEGTTDSMDREIDSIEAQIEFLSASQSRLDSLSKNTAASLEAAVAALANLHQLQQSLREQLQLHAQLLEQLERERQVLERLKQELATAGR